MKLYPGSSRIQAVGVVVGGGSPQQPNDYRTPPPPLFSSRMRILFLSLLLAGCANEPPVRIHVSDPSYLIAEVPAHHPGVASWYGEKYRGRPTASGELFDPGAMTAAHRTLPFGTRLLVKRGSRSVVVTVNDRGPFVLGRELDLSWAAFRELADPDLGLIDVTYEGVSSLK